MPTESYDRRCRLLARDIDDFPRLQAETVDLGLGQLANGLHRYLAGRLNGIANLFFGVAGGLGGQRNSAGQACPTPG
jgi:hypothetical protein